VQVCPVAHTVPHVPQLAESVCRFLQLPEQLVWPVEHVQLLAVQLWPLAAEHTFVHEPQCAISLVKFTQAPEHAVRLAPHVVVHVPAEHT
jgi:hypothetical protein